MIENIMLRSCKFDNYGVLEFYPYDFSWSCNQNRIWSCDFLCGKPTINHWSTDIERNCEMILTTRLRISFVLSGETITKYFSYLSFISVILKLNKTRNKTHSKLILMNYPRCFHSSCPVLKIKKSVNRIAFLCIKVHLFRERTADFGI